MKFGMMDVGQYCCEKKVSAREEHILLEPLSLMNN